MYLSENIFILVAVRFRCAGPRSALFKEIVNNQDFSTSGLSFFAYGCKGENLISDSILACTRCACEI